ncbi:MAG: XdhC family protein [Pseudomonadota bacterium]|nr:XdhC family protein [Pseudomonadota bacterium]
MTAPEFDDVIESQLRLRQRRVPYAVATVIRTVGSSAAKAGSKAIIDAHGRVLTGWVGGGCAEAAVREAARDCLKNGQTHVLHIDMTDEVLGIGMPCGGQMDVFIEPQLPIPTVWILGHGRMAESVASLAVMLGLGAIVHDLNVTSERLPSRCQMINDDPGFERLVPLKGDAVIVASQHKGDHLALRQVLKTPVEYVALIASVKRARLILDYLREAGFSSADLARIRAPAGVDLGGHTAEEIALSVLAEFTMVRRGGSGQLMRERIH